MIDKEQRHFYITDEVKHFLKRWKKALFPLKPLTTIIQLFKYLHNFYIYRRLANHERTSFLLELFQCFSIIWKQHLMTVIIYINHFGPQKMSSLIIPLLI